MPNPTITPEAIQYVAQKAWFFFVVYDYTILELGAYLGDATNITGQGVNTLDEIIEFLERPFPSRIVVQLDIGSIQPVMVPVTADNVRDIKTAFVAIYGNVNKPNVYRPIPVWATTF